MRFRERIEELAASEPVVVDFAGISTISPSFADELFAKINQELIDRGAVRFENLSPGVDAIARYVVAARQRGLTPDAS
jgi:STAS-like domain of unknown function (DUF4325)